MRWRTEKQPVKQTKRERKQRERKQRERKQREGKQRERGMKQMWCEGVAVWSEWVWRNSRRESWPNAWLLVKG